MTRHAPTSISLVIEPYRTAPRVLIKTMIPGLEYQPTERIEISKLERVDGDDFSRK